MRIVKADREAEWEEACREFQLLVPVFASVRHCLRMGWVDPESAKRWEDRHDDLIDQINELSDVFAVPNLKWDPSAVPLVTAMEIGALKRMVQDAHARGPHDGVREG